MNLGVVGLGRMGRSFAVALVESRAVVHGFDTDSEARSRSADRGVVVHDELGSLAAECQAVVTSLPTTTAVRSVVGVLGDIMDHGSLVIETSTSSPAFAEVASRRLAERGVRFVDAPVSGKAPELAIMVGGEEGVLGEAGAILELAAARVVHLGRLGGGYAVKLLQQYVKYARFLVAAEALTFAQREGLDIGATIDALLAGTGGLPGLATAEDYFGGDPSAIAARGPVSTISKDMELARTMFAEAGFRSPSFDALCGFFLAADRDELHDRPYPEVIDLLPGLRYPRTGPHDDR